MGQSFRKVAELREGLALKEEPQTGRDGVGKIMTQCREKGRYGMGGGLTEALPISPKLHPYCREGSVGAVAR